MNYTVRLTDTAKQDLRDIAFRLAEYTKDISAAKGYVAELAAECKRLEQFPNSGAIPKDRILMSAGYRFTVHKNHLIFYLVDEAKLQVNIMAVFNAKQDYLRVMKKYL